MDDDRYSLGFVVTPEGRVKNAIDRWIKQNLPGAYVYKPRGGPYGVAGTPDYFICWCGVFIGIEAKAPGQNPRPLQQAALRRIQDAGGIAAVVRGDQLNRLEAIRLEVYKRVHYPGLRLAGDGGADPLQPPENDGGVLPRQ